MSPQDWQYIPDDVLEEDQIKQQAETWAEQQRRQLAEEWAANQQAIFDDDIRNQRVMRAGGLQGRQADLEPSGQSVAAGQSVGGNFGTNAVGGEWGTEARQEEFKQGARAKMGVGQLPELIDRVNSMAAPTAEFIAKGGERLGAAARGEDWRSMPSGLERGVEGLREDWENRGELFPAQKGIMEAGSSLLNLIPANLMAKAGLAVKGGLGVREAAKQASKAAGDLIPSASVDDVSTAGLRTTDETPWDDIIRNEPLEAKLPKPVSLATVENAASPGWFKVMKDGKSIAHFDSEAAAKQSAATLNAGLGGAPKSAFSKFAANSKEFFIDLAPTQLANFKRWFTGSKILDDDSWPKILYHATFADKPFEVFRKSNDLGFHFGTHKAASDRTGKSGKVGAFFLNIKNPLETKDLGSWGKWDWANELKRLGMVTDERGFVTAVQNAGLAAQQAARRINPTNVRSFINTFQAAKNAGEYDFATKAGQIGEQKYIREFLESKGYDGVIYKNAHEDAGSLSYIVFRPEQIKSVMAKEFNPVSKSVMQAAPQITGGVVGAAVYQDDPNLSPEENLQRRALYAAGGMGLAHGAVKLGSKSTLGGTVQDVSGKQNVGGIQNVGQAAGKNVKPPVIKPPDSVGLSQLWDRTSNIIGKMGARGQELSGKIHNAREYAERAAGEWEYKMPTVRALSKKEMENLVDVAEGKASSMNLKVLQAYREWIYVRTEIRKAAEAVGMKPGFIDDYFPHRYDPKKFKEQWAANARHLMNTGQASSEAEAQSILNTVYKMQDLVRNRKMGNLELSRKADIPGYEKTHKAIYGYIEQAAHRIGQVKEFGISDRKAMYLIGKLKQEGYDGDTAKKMFNAAVGANRPDDIFTSISSAVRTYNTLKLGLSALTNAGQSVNTATVVGGVRTLMNLPGAMFSKEAHDFALKSGIIIDSAIAGVREGTGLHGALGKVGAPFFSNVERFNRTLAAVAGRDYAKSMAAKAIKGDKNAIKALDMMKLDSAAIIQRGGQLTEDDMIRAARNIVQRTQFKVGAQDLPYWASSPGGKIISQFRTFAYNQTAFLGREIIQPALKGNAMPALRFLIYGTAAGIPIVALKDLIRGRETDTSPEVIIPRALLQVGGAGLLSDLLQDIVPIAGGKPIGEERARVNLAEQIGGPTASSAMQAFAAGSQALQGKGDYAKRFGLSHIPVLGPTAASKFVPYKTQTGNPGTRGGLRGNSGGRGR